jgi:hypothetical protein
MKTCLSEVYLIALSCQPLDYKGPCGEGGALRFVADPDPDITQAQARR